MARNPTPEELRAQSRFCRKAATEEQPLAYELLDHAFQLAQLAQHIDRHGSPGFFRAEETIERFQRVAQSGDLTRAQRWRQRAEECRAVGDQLCSPAAQAAYRQMAESYEVLAAREEERALSAVRRKPQAS
ncbi:MAG TPA: hypothetical protein VN668_16435 [Stellaceae bacterium]|nr:hypothetical protein [Stellaceae bacterium]